MYNLRASISLIDMITPIVDVCYSAHWLSRWHKTMYYLSKCASR